MSTPAYVGIAALIVIATVLIMEAVATLSHKYIMHGWGWNWHKSHHEEERHHGFEKNDLYAACFALVAIALFWIGTSLWPVWWIAVGVTVYGALYFIMHDGLVHKRWPFTLIPRHGYLKRVYQAHRLHHAVEGKDGCVSFGFIYAKPTDRLLAELKQNKGALRPHREQAPHHD
jgi:beta-carotene 3-hydroxylase